MSLTFSSGSGSPSNSSSSIEEGMCWRKEVEACSGAGCLSLKNHDGLPVGLSICTSSMSVYSVLSLYLHKNNDVKSSLIASKHCKGDATSVYYYARYWG